MRKDLIEKMKIPEGVEITIEGNMVTIKKNGNETRRKILGCSARKEDNFLVLEEKKATKNQKKMLKTCRAHVINAIIGIEKKYVYRLQICAVHFPMTITHDKTKNELLIKNYLGEVKPRIAKILKDVEIKIDREIITVEGHDKEKTGQTAANIERAVKINNRDRRVFQDGIYITEKPE